MAFIEKLQAATVGNKEFSWINVRYNGMNLLPDEIRVQEGDTCVFEAFSAGAEMAFRQDAAMKGEFCDIKFSSSSLVKDYEESIGMKLSEEPAAKLGSDIRQKTASSLFRNQGALATSSNWEGERRIKLSNCFKPRSARFDGIANLIRQGKAVVGCFPVQENFATLGTDEIYRYNQRSPGGGTSGQLIGSHYVLFVVYGYDGCGEAYLVFLNSAGTEFGDNGFGRVYFSDTYKDWFYLLTAKVPAVANIGASTSSNIAQVVQEETEPKEEVERPRQRRRLDNDGIGTATSSAGHQAPDTGDWNLA